MIRCSFIVIISIIFVLAGCDSPTTPDGVPESDSDLPEDEEEAWTPGLQFILNHESQEYAATVGTATSAQTIVIPDEYEGLPVTAIADYGFEEHRHVEQVVLPETIERIGDNAFYESVSLVDLELPASVTHIGRAAFAYSPIQQVSLPKGLQEIGAYAFSGASFQQQTLTVPDGITSIEGATFSSSEALIENLILPEGLTFIGNSAFSGYPNLEAVTFPSSIEEIDIYAFNGVSLRDVTVLAESPPVLGFSNIAGHPDLEIRVPAESVEDYKNEWFNYLSEYIIPIQ